MTNPVFGNLRFSVLFMNQQMEKQTELLSYLDVETQLLLKIFLVRAVCLCAIKPETNLITKCIELQYSS